MKNRFFIFAALLFTCSSAHGEEDFRIELFSDCSDIWSITLNGKTPDWRGYFKTAGPLPSGHFPALDFQTAAEVSGITIGRLKPGPFDIFLNDPFRYPKDLPGAYRFGRFCRSSEPCRILGIHGFVFDTLEFWIGTEKGERRFWGGAFQFCPLFKRITLQPFTLISHPDPEPVGEKWFAPGPRLIPGRLFHTGTSVLFRSSVFHADMLSAVSLNTLYTPGMIFRCPFTLRLGGIVCYGGFSLKAGPYISPAGSVPKNSFSYRLGLEGKNEDFSGELEINGGCIAHAGENLPFLETERVYKADGRWKTGIFTSSAGFGWIDRWNRRGVKRSERIYRTGYAVGNDWFKIEATGTATERELELREGRCSVKAEFKPEWLTLGFGASLHSRFALAWTSLSCILTVKVPLRRFMLKGSLENPRPVYLSNGWYNRLVSELKGEVILVYSFPSD